MTAVISEQRDEIMLLCKELEELGGGIQTRLEQVSVLVHGGNNMGESVAKFIGLNYNTTLVTFGI